MNKKSFYLVLSLISAVGFAVMLWLTMTDVISLNPLCSVVFLVLCAVFVLLYSRQNNAQPAEQDFVAAERARSVEKPKHVRDFEIVRDCCDSIVNYLKEDRNIAGVTVAKNLDDFEGYYETEIDTFEFLDCLYFQTDELIDSVQPEFLTVLEDAFLAKKFFQVDATRASEGLFLFKREDETFYETYYVYASDPELLKADKIQAESLGGCWYYVKTNKNIKELLNL